MIQILFVRCAFLGMLVYACGGHFVYEQPRSSLLFRRERMMWLCRKITAPKIALTFAHVFANNGYHECVETHVEIFN